jgi:hypothetical protein
LAGIFEKNSRIPDFSNRPSIISVDANCVGRAKAVSAGANCSEAADEMVLVWDSYKDETLKIPVDLFLWVPM